jgi:hypothetical protein
MKPPLRPWAPRLLRSKTGFTLVELAVGTTIGALVIVITTAVFAPLLRLNQRLDSQIRLQERWSRVNAILNFEIKEAYDFKSAGNRYVLSICEPLNFGDPSSSLCRNFAGFDNQYGYDVEICYELVPSEAPSGTPSLTRRGPMVEPDGSLRAQEREASCEEFAPEVVANGVTTFSMREVSPEEYIYNISFRDPLNPNGPTLDKTSSIER